jgi:uncharacterized membrane protein YsdA (DUF1294 family)
MYRMMFLMLYYLGVVNLLAFGLMGADKSRAKRRKRRISERTLFISALIGGAFGAWIGMKLFRHKTKHPSFQYGIPALLILNIGVIYWIKARLL